MSESQLPKLLNARNIENILNIPYSEAAKILEQKSLPIVIIGKTKRVFSNDFYLWLRTTDTYHKRKINYLEWVTKG